MKKPIWLTAIAASTILFGLVGCGEPAAKQELDKNDTNKAQAKTDSTTKPADATAAKTESKKSEDIWTYYNNATWSDDFNGLKVQIEKVVVTDKSPKLPGDKSAGDKSSLVGVKFKIENTTKGKFTIYPDQAKLVTSTGEQIDIPEMFGSDHIGGEIDEGVIKEGQVIWNLQRGHAEDIKWVKFDWNGHQGGETEFGAQRKAYSPKLELVK